LWLAKVAEPATSTLITRVSATILVAMFPPAPDSIGDLQARGSFAAELRRSGGSVALNPRRISGADRRPGELGSIIGKCRAVGFVHQSGSR
jgi:hypothetical protein